MLDAALLRCFRQPELLLLLLLLLLALLDFVPYLLTALLLVLVVPTPLLFRLPLLVLAAPTLLLLLLLLLRPLAVGVSHSLWGLPAFEHKEPRRLLLTLLCSGSPIPTAHHISIALLLLIPIPATSLPALNPLSSPGWHVSFPAVLPGDTLLLILLFINIKLGLLLLQQKVHLLSKA